LIERRGSSSFELQQLIRRDRSSGILVIYLSQRGARSAVSIDQMGRSSTQNLYQQYDTNSYATWRRISSYCPYLPSSIGWSLKRATLFMSCGSESGDSKSLNWLIPPTKSGMACCSKFRIGCWYRVVFDITVCCSALFMFLGFFCSFTSS